MTRDDDTTGLLRQVERERDALQSAILLLHRVAILVRDAGELEPTYYALLTGVSAGVGLGLNRAMLFLLDERDRGVLRCAAAVGPASPEDAARIWRSIDRDAPDLETLYEAGLRQLAAPGPLDRKARTLTVSAHDASPISLALRRGRLVAGEGSDDLGGFLDLVTAVAAPMRGRNAVRGVLYADNRVTGRILDPVRQRVFAMVADHAGRAIENAHRFEEIARAARTDALTGLGHHGSLMQALGEAVTAAAGGAVGLVMIDLDDFKQVNDRHGHLAGDAVLAEVAARLRSAVRTGEQAYRYGGEEFAVLLPGADRQGAVAVGERMRRAIADTPFALPGVGKLSITGSVGVASLPADASDAQALVAAADAALLRSKAAGKNRVEAA